MDDAGPEREGTLCRLPLQCNCRELGEEAAGLGDADGELINRSRYKDARGAGAGPVLGPGGGEDEEEDGGCREGGGTVPSSQWSQLLAGEFDVCVACVWLCLRLFGGCMTASAYTSILFHIVDSHQWVRGNLCCFLLSDDTDFIESYASQLCTIHFTVRTNSCSASFGVETKYWSYCRFIWTLPACSWQLILLYVKTVIGLNCESRHSTCFLLMWAYVG